MSHSQNLIFRGLGVFFKKGGDIDRSVPLVEGLDPPPFSCFKCWKGKHTHAKCKNPIYEVFCRNCGRRDRQTWTCERCRSGYENNGGKIQPNSQLSTPVSTKEKLPLISPKQSTVRHKSANLVKSRLPSNKNALSKHFKGPGTMFPDKSYIDSTVLEDPLLDPPPFSCFACWLDGHNGRVCPDPVFKKYCDNCGRRGRTVVDCERCAEGYKRFVESPETKAAQGASSVDGSRDSGFGKDEDANFDSNNSDNNNNDNKDCVIVDDGDKREYDNPVLDHSNFNYVACNNIGNNINKNENKANTSGIRETIDELSNLQSSLEKNVKLRKHKKEEGRGLPAGKSNFVNLRKYSSYDSDSEPDDEHQEYHDFMALAEMMNRSWAVGRGERSRLSRAAGLRPVNYKVVFRPESDSISADLSSRHPPGHGRGIKFMR